MVRSHGSLSPIASGWEDHKPSHFPVPCRGQRMRRAGGAAATVSDEAPRKSKQGRERKKQRKGKSNEAEVGKRAFVSVFVRMVCVCVCVERRVQ